MGVIQIAYTRNFKSKFPEISVQALFKILWDEVPEHPEVTIDTTGKSLEDSVDYVMAQLEEKLG